MIYDVMLKIKSLQVENIKLATYLREYDILFFLFINASICHFSIELLSIGKY